MNADCTKKSANANWTNGCMDEWLNLFASVIATAGLLLFLGMFVLVVVRMFQSRRVEQQSVQNGQEVAATIREIDSTLHKICDTMTASGQLSRDNQEDMRRMIRDVSTLVLDVERRLNGEIKDNRDWVSMQFQKHGTNVNFNGGANGTQIGDGNKQL